MSHSRALVVLLLAGVGVLAHLAACTSTPRDFSASTGGGGAGATTGSQQAGTGGATGTSSNSVTTGTTGSTGGGTPCIPGSCSGQLGPCERWCEVGGNCVKVPDATRDGSRCGTCSACANGTCAPGSDGAIDADCAPGDVCNALGQCSCADGTQDNGETGTDCGGACAACQVCQIDSDCTGAPPLCTRWICQANQCLPVAEPDQFPCGFCEACAGGQCTLVSGVDPTGQCAPGVCNGQGACSCSDGMTDGGESDIDCGGPCAPCGPGQICNVDLDCITQNCSNGICCSAGCGGLCTTCDATGACVSVQPGTPGNCQGNEVCITGGGCSCNDGAVNNGETDVDCGGTCFNRCADGKLCNGPQDCQSNLCAAGFCQCMFWPCVTSQDCGGSSISSTTANGTGAGGPGGVGGGPGGSQCIAGCCQLIGP